MIDPGLQNVDPVTTVRLSTRCGTVSLLVRKPVAPLYVAVIRWVPSVSDDVVNVRRRRTVDGDRRAEVRRRRLNCTVPLVTAVAPA